MARVTRAASGGRRPLTAAKLRKSLAAMRLAARCVVGRGGQTPGERLGRQESRQVGFDEVERVGIYYVGSVFG